MKLSTLQAVLVLLATPVCLASDSHRRLHQLLEKKHAHVHGRHTHETSSLDKRGTCDFPTDDDNLVAVTPDEMNAGWAMSPDQKCSRDSWCPYACKPGMVMAQWDPDSTYDYPASMNGGLYCDSNGSIKKPFSSKPYCVEGTGAVKAVNKCKGKMSWCQTILPGNENMVIPTMVEIEATIAVPDINYWQETAAHYYINGPGSSEADCKWGDDTSPIGNWSPIVAGANTDANGLTFVKLGMNPIWEESGLSSSAPSYNIKIECPDGDCVGLPCAIEDGKVKSSLAADGAGGSPFCVVTVPKGATAHIVAYDGSGGSGGDEPSEPEPETSTTIVPTTSLEPTTTSTTSTTSTTPTTTSTPTPTTTSTTSTSTTTTSTTSTTPTSTSTKSKSKTHSHTRTTAKAYPSVGPGIFHENGTSSEDSPTTSSSDDSSTSTSDTPATTTDKDNEAGRQKSSAAMAGLVVAFVAATCFF